VREHPVIFSAGQSSKIRAFRPFSVARDARALPLKFMNRKVKLLVLLAAFIALAIAIVPRQSYRYQERSLPATFDEFYEVQRSASQKLNARPGCEERLVRYAPRTEYAILYVHGFGACRAEGEDVMDQIHSGLKANTYYIRLPGHGTNVEDHAQARYQDYLNSVEDAIRMMPQLGDKVILAGTSMGGLLAASAAANHPDKTYALILASPFFEFYRKEGNIAAYPGGTLLAQAVMGGKIRDVRKKPGDTTDSRVDGYENFWYDQQYVSALESLAKLKRAVSGPDLYGRITSPVLMLYYYKDEANQDKAANVKDMLEGFHQFGSFYAAASNESDCRSHPGGSYTPFPLGQFGPCFRTKAD
jgi:pimeloyl-ACP methyl ester carboxylesterase